MMQELSSVLATFSWTEGFPSQPQPCIMLVISVTIAAATYKDH
uniref:Uncharacterized protein n=1 Tax=Solanum lycopersicum TaxID=4081 RepID=A0A3Q7J8X1_SOLLC